MLLRSLTIVLILLLAACQPPAAPPSADIANPVNYEADIAAIRQLEDDWNQAVEAGSVDGYAAVLDDNIELLPTDAPPISGVDNYRAMLNGVFTSDDFKIEVLAPSIIEVDGDLGWARYAYIIHRTPKGGSETISSHRKFLDIMRRQEDGGWRVYKHIWNYNEPNVVP
jgi:uncharacterized protein (TIGR02246 family)